MKNLILENKLKRPEIVTEALQLYKFYIEIAGYKLELTRKTSTRNYTIKKQEGTAVGDAFGVVPEEILQDAVGGYRLAILIYSEPLGTNPLQYPYNLNGMTPISIPESWYINSSNPAETLCAFMLHEAGHAGFMFKDFYKTDVTHLPNNRDINPMEYDRRQLGLSTQNQIYYYADLLRELHPYLENVPAVPTYRRTLRLGIIGDDVSELQRVLKKKGYFTYPFITKTFGAITQKAVKDFQKANFMLVDGIAGPKTLEKLYGTSS